jgi:hypothetical protein
MNNRSAILQCVYEDKHGECIRRVFFLIFLINVSKKRGVSSIRNLRTLRAVVTRDPPNMDW